MWKTDKNMGRERIYKRLSEGFKRLKEGHETWEEGHETWKEFFYYGLYDLIEKETIFSKLPQELTPRESVKSFDNLSSLFKNIFLIPILVLWKIILIRFERGYYKRKYPQASTLADIKTENFDFLFVLE